MFNADGWIDMMQHIHTHRHTVEKSSATQKFMTYACELILALVHKGTILILIIGIKNSGGVVVSSGMISYKSTR